jgi:hypothetical protein
MRKKAASKPPSLAVGGSRRRAIGVTISLIRKGKGTVTSADTEMVNFTLVTSTVTWTAD